jgi:hypothetical protein
VKESAQQHQKVTQQHLGPSVIAGAARQPFAQWRIKLAVLLLPMMLAEVHITGTKICSAPHGEYNKAQPAAPAVPVIMPARLH